MGWSRRTITPMGGYYYAGLGGRELVSVADEETLRRRHRPRWSWATLRWRCTCGAGLPCQVRAAPSCPCPPCRGEVRGLWAGWRRFRHRVREQRARGRGRWWR